MCNVRLFAEVIGMRMETSQAVFPALSHILEKDVELY